MTIAYCGLPGSGKSYSAVENVIIGTLKSGRSICTNLPLKLDVIEKDYPDAKIKIIDNESIENDPEYLINLPNGSVIVLDEIWQFWPSGMSVNKIPQAHKSFFTEHRHRVGEDGYSTEIVLITQDFAQVAVFVRSLISDTYRTVKLSAVGQNKRFRVDIYSGCVTGQNPPKTNLTRSLFGKYKPKIYKYYSSHTKNESSFEAGLEEKPDRRNNVFYSARFLSIPFSILLMYFAASSLYSFIYPDTDLNQEIVTKTDTHSLKPSSEAYKKSVIKPTQLSTKWKLAAIAGPIAVLESSDGISRYISANDCELINWEYSCEVNGQVVTRWTL